MPEHTSHDSEAITLLAENVGEIREAVTELKEERVTLEASRAVLEAAIKGLGALRTQVLENDIGKLQLALNDKTRELTQEISRFEAAVAEIDRRAEAGDDALKQQLAAESQQLRADAAALRTQLAAYQEWGGKVELSLKEHAEKLAAIPATIKGAEGRSPNPRGKYESGVKYARLDIAELAGSSYISAEDDNDEKPSPSSKKWKLMARRGGGGGASNDINALSGTATISQGGTGQTTAILAARALLDGISTTRGTILYRGASGWTTLAPSTAGYFLSTQGSGADPIFTAASGSGLGDFSGPASSTDNEIVRFDGAGGKNGQTSGLTIGDVASTNITISPIAANNLTLSGGSSGASLVLGQGTAGGVTITGGSIAPASLTLNSTASNGGYQRFQASGTVYGYIGTATGILGSGGTDALCIRSETFIGLGTGGATERARLTATGNLLIGGTVDVAGSGGLKVFGTTAATSTTSGAFQCAGGAGIAGALWVGGQLTISAPAPYHLLTATAGTNYAYTEWLNTSGGLRIGIENSIGTGVVPGAAPYAGFISQVTAQPLVIATSNAIRMTIAATGAITLGTSSPLTVTATTASTSTTTGALIVSGGVGVAGALNVGGAIACANTVNAVSPTSPNRTITMVIGGTTYYLHAKTTND